MDREKMIHSKCPGCKKYGLPAIRFFSIRRSPSTLICKECGRKYRTNWGINTIAFFGTLGIFAYVQFQWIHPLQGTISNELYQALSLGSCAIWICAFLTYQRFAPLHEIFE